MVDELTEWVKTRWVGLWILMYFLSAMKNLEENLSKEMTHLD